MQMLDFKGLALCEISAHVNPMVHQSPVVSFNCMCAAISLDKHHRSTCATLQMQIVNSRSFIQDSGIQESHVRCMHNFRRQDVK